jgi:predicted DNA-binding WGR domain protein
MMPLAAMEKFWSASGGRYTAGINHSDGADGMRAAYLEKRDTEKRQFRFYRIIITQTLFGPWALIRELGRIGSPGTVREVWYDSKQEALEAGEKLMKQKAKRGYRESPSYSPSRKGAWT